jgi:FKBP-type peptidyl-prolyl cis-trans isomerase
VIAAAFLFTTIGTSVALIMSAINEDKKTTDVPVEEVKKMDNFTPVQKVDALQVVDLQEGTGEAVTAGANVTVDYTGAIASTGSIFESSLDSGQKATFGLDQVIAGWSEGLVGMKVGGKRRLLIPAAKAYGEQSPSPKIPANSDLVFDITLHSINK